jgi:hypothetical protein
VNQDLNLPRNVAELGERETTLANRAGGLTIVTISLAIVSAMAMPIAFRETQRTDVRIVSAVPLAGAVATALRARVARRELDALRSQKRELQLEIAGVTGEASDATTTAVRRTAERSAP